jgi:hypothetical protein
MCFSALPLLSLVIGCTPNHSIALESTIEEPSRPASLIEMRDLPTAQQLTRGFYDLEEGSWRWTMGKFAVSVGTPPAASRFGAWVVLKFNLPEVVLRHSKAITLSAAIDHTPLSTETYDQAGPHEYRQEAPAHLLQKDAVFVEFSLDHYWAAGTIEARELGLIVSSVALEPK